MSQTVDHALKSERLSQALVELNARIDAYARNNALLREQNEELRRQLALLQREFKRLLAKRRASGAEADGQGDLFSDEAPEEVEELEVPPHLNEAPDGETPDDPIKARNKPKRPARALDASKLPRKEVVHELPEEERRCPRTGVALVETGAKVFEEIEYTPAQLCVIEHRRVIYGPPPEVAKERKIDPVVARMPVRPLEGASAGASLLAQVLVQKYEHHLPLYRQEAIFQQAGLALPRQTLCDWVMGCADLLAPIADELMHEIGAGPVTGLDDTRLKCRGEKGQGYFQAYLWTFTNPAVTGVAFRFTEGRSAEQLKVHLGGVKARYLIGDAYAGNSAAAREAGLKVIHGGCWAHVLRGFREAHKEAGKLAGLFRADIRALYDIEDEANGRDLDPDSRRDLRRSRARPILARLFRRTLGWKEHFSTSGKMGAALRYLRNNRQELKCFLAEGRVPLDNNACENAIRPVALGRKNFLFAGSARGGRCAATLYTLVESCKLAGVDRLEYLRDVLVRVHTQPADRLAELVPARWKQLRGAPTGT